MKVGRKGADPADREKDGKGEKGGATATRRRSADGPARTGRKGGTAARGGSPRTGTSARRPHEPRGLRQGPQTAPTARPVERPARPKTTTQAKARAKARKAKAPKVVRPPLRERLIARLATIDLRPQTLMAKVPFVVLIIGALAVGLGVTLWLSTAAAQRSYQLATARATNDALTQQKEALERDVLEAESAPALAEAARNLGMIPSKDTAHLVQDPMGNWIVVGKPKPAEGAPPPPLNTKLPDEKPPAPPASAVPAGPKPKPGSAPEVPTRLTPLMPGAVPLAGMPSVAGTEVPVHLPSATDHAPAGAALPGPALAPGLNLVPVPVGGPPATDLPPAAVAPAPLAPAPAPPAAVPPPAPVAPAPADVMPAAPVAGATQ
jgi:cell division protein FtsB